MQHECQRMQPAFVVHIIDYIVFHCSQIHHIFGFAAQPRAMFRSRTYQKALTLSINAKSFFALFHSPSLSPPPSLSLSYHSLSLSLSLTSSLLLSLSVIVNVFDASQGRSSRSRQNIIDIVVNLVSKAESFFRHDEDSVTIDQKDWQDSLIKGVHIHPHESWLQNSRMDCGARPPVSSSS